MIRSWVAGETIVLTAGLMGKWGESVMGGRALREREKLGVADEAGDAI
jgi:hypothetical protein